MLDNLNMNVFCSMKFRPEPPSQLLQASLTETKWVTTTDMEDANNRALLDFDDISIKYTSGVS
jgi:hypothetical protein